MFLVFVDRGHCCERMCFVGVSGQSVDLQTSSSASQWVWFGWDLGRHLITSLSQTVSHVLGSLCQHFRQQVSIASSREDASVAN